MKHITIVAFMIFAINAQAQVRYGSEGGKIKAVWVDNRSEFTDSTLVRQLLDIPYPIGTKIELMNELTKIQPMPGENRFDLYLNHTNRKLWKSLSK